MGLGARPFGEYKSTMQKLQNEVNAAEKIRKMAREERAKQKERDKKRDRKGRIAEEQDEVIE